MPPSMNIKSSESARLSTTGIVLISIAGVVLVIALSAIGVLVVRRRRAATSTTSSKPESRLRSVWILCRRRKRNRNSISQHHHSNTTQSQAKHLRKLSTATNASSLHDCRVAGPVPLANARVPQQWFLQGSPQQEISDPYDDEMNHGSQGDRDWSPINLKEYSQGYRGGSVSPFSQPKQTLRYQEAWTPRRGSVTTTLVPPSGPSPVRSTFEIESLAPSHQYPFAPSEPNSPVYGRFLRPELVSEERSQRVEYEYKYEYDSPGDSRRNTFGYPTTTTVADRPPSPTSTPTSSAAASSPVISPPAPAVSPARQVQVRYQQQQQQQQQGGRTEQPSLNKPQRPSVHAMLRQQSDAPSFALSIPRSVSPSEAQEDEVAPLNNNRPARPSLRRDRTLPPSPPRISITAPSESVPVAAPVSVTTADQEEEQEEETPSYFTSRTRTRPAMPPPQPSSATLHAKAYAQAASPGLHTAFRSAFFLDAGPERGVAMSSMPQTPAVDE